MPKFIKNPLPSSLLDVSFDIFEFSPKEGDSHVLAQLGTFKQNHFQTSRDFTSSMVHEPSLTKINSSNIFKLKGTIPLIATWMSGNYTHMAPDQSLINKFKLICRVEKDIIFWDDVKRPKFNVVTNKPSSLYSFPNYTESFVKINSEYLQGYLFDNEKTAIQIFQEKRIVNNTDSIDSLLGKKGYYIHRHKEYELRIQRIMGEKHKIHVEVNGYRTLFNRSHLQKHAFLLGQEQSHMWKGFDNPITSTSARQTFAFEYCYVSDDVLSKYEEHEAYVVYPESGGVSYGNQWSVSHCDRIGRNAIRVDIKKLYEGVPPDVIDHWNSFSIDPETINRSEKNIADLSGSLLRNYFKFGRLMTKNINKILGESLQPFDIITFDEIEIERMGFLQFSAFKSITNHISANSFSIEQFTTRCKHLYIILVENLRENNLRRIVNSLGFISDQTKSYRSLKLLDLLLKYYHIAHQSGLNPIIDKLEIINRFESYKDFSPLKEFFALSDLRQLDAHKSDKNFSDKLSAALKVFGINKVGITHNYTLVCDHIYEKLSERLIAVNDLLIRFH